MLEDYKNFIISANGRHTVVRRSRAANLSSCADADFSNASISGFVHADNAATVILNESHFVIMPDEEIGGRPIRAGESFGAAFIVGFFDSIEEMEKAYDRYTGHTGVEVGEQGWKLIR